ncbi:MAG: ABC transporter ATP-binding protein [Rhizobacter sp.]|nr:ABC transporter ATP-binding protein [Chlorobiales bacterium]
MSNAVIEIRGLSKKYVIQHETQHNSLRDKAAESFRKLFKRQRGGEAKDAQSNEAFWALRDVSFDVHQGEAVGIIGRNGAGKSTLLKILSQIVAPTTGEIKIHGRVASLLEVGTGFHAELSGRENIYLNGSILGMRRKEIDSKFDEIVDFAGVERFLDTPVKRYSSGMYVRLAFAVAAYLEPEILIVDEVLAVGDAEFQKKCLGKMREVSSNEGRTVLFVSHNMAAVDNLCTRGVVLNQGQVQLVGTKSEAITAYLATTSVHNFDLRHRQDRRGLGGIRILEIELRDTASGRSIDTMMSGQDIDVCFHYEATEEESSRQVIVSLQLRTNLDVPAVLHHNRLSGQAFGKLPRVGTFICRLRRLPLVPSTYRLTYSLDSERGCLDSIDNATDVVVTDGDFYGTGEVPPSSHATVLADGAWRVESREEITESSLLSLETRNATI